MIVSYIWERFHSVCHSEQLYSKNDIAYQINVAYISGASLQLNDVDEEKCLLLIFRIERGNEMNCEPSNLDC